MKRHWKTLEYPKILERLARHTDFSAGADLARTLEPTDDYRLAREWLALTAEARALLLARPDFGLGGISDVRSLVEQARRGVIIEPSELLRVRDTLLGTQRLQRTLERLDAQFPRLADLAFRFVPQPELAEAIGRVLNDRGEIKSDASPELARIRRELRVSQDRIQEKLQRMISSSSIARYLQESVITRRQGRFVIPVQANFKGHVEGVVHDRSSSGQTVFMEPLSVVDLNNALRELAIAEEQEIHRLLSALTMQVARVGEEIEATVAALAELDLTLARARYAEALLATEPELLPPPARPPEVEGENAHPGSVLRLKSARHPLLHPDDVVAVNVLLDEETHVLVITGPNTGGKTVSLKTVGLLTLMARAGMHIPVDEGSSLSCFERVYADIGDEQSIEQSLSTFSAHLANIMSFLDEVDHRSLVLLDELGAGTDPAEGSALARSLLEHFRTERCTALVATHYPELKLYAHNTPGVRNASMEFDTETLAPTFRLSIGLPGRSNAFAIARRLGMPEPVVKAAQGMLSGEELRAEDMLEDLHELRLEAARTRDAERRARREAEQEAQKLRDRLANIEEERRKILRQAEEEAREEIEDLRKELRDLKRRLAAIPSPEIRTAVEELEEDLESLEEESVLPEPEPLVESAPAPPPEPAPAGLERRPRPGDTVRVKSLGMEAAVADIEGDEVEVQMGAMRTRVPLKDVTVLSQGPASQPEPIVARSTARSASPGIQLDLRGLTAAEARQRLDRYIDDAAMAELPWVRIVHGKGTGTLRREVRNFLSGHPLITSYEVAPEREGGDGATVARLVRTR
jgi:DNA mismatch repair protein MutS2